MQLKNRQSREGYETIYADWLTLNYSLQLVSPQSPKTDLERASSLVEERQNNHDNSDENLPSLQGLRVLIVDGDVDTIDIFGLVLQEKEAEVFGTTSTAKAIAKASTWYPDILICNVSLPGKDGYALVRELRGLQTDPARNLLAIAVTTLLREQDCLNFLPQNFRSEGFQRYFPVPTDVYKLVTVVAELARPQT